MPILYTISVTGKLTKTVEVVGLDNGDPLNEEMFISRVYSACGIDYRLKTFKASDYQMKVTGQRNIIGL